MKDLFTRFPGKVVRLIITIIALSGYLLSLAGWYISPDNWFLPAFFSPGFVWAWFFLWVLAFLWWGKKNGAILVFLIVLATAGLPPLRVSISIGREIGVQRQKQKNSLRVMQWNCMNLPGSDKTITKYRPERYAATEFINRYNPDILCLQDFCEIRFPLIHSNRALLRDSLGYSWEHVVPYATELRPYGFVTLSTAIYAKKPFLNQGAVYFTNAAFPEAIVWVDVALEGKPVRVITTHFASMHISSYKFFNPARMPYHLKPDSAVIMSPDLLTKLNFFLKKHREQARQLRNFLDTCPIPVVLAADLNTVPANYLYRQVKGSMEDGFIGSKTGMGNTYNFLAPNIRIDYLFHDKRLKTISFQHFKDGFFDHDHLLADYMWRNP